MHVGHASARGARSRWYGRLSGAHVVVALAGLLGGVLTLAALRADAREVRVLVATRDLQVGALVAPRDVGTVVVRGDLGALPHLLRENQRARAIGRVLTAPLRRGDVVRASDLVAPAASSGGRSMSFAVDAADAVGGDIDAGDRIDVVAFARDGKRAGYALVDAAVLHASAPHSAGPLHTSDNRVVITVAVDAAGAMRMTAAITDARVVVVKATGAAPILNPSRYELPSTIGGERG